jgi:hypothetical protein
MLKNSTSMKKYTSRKNALPFLAKFLLLRYQMSLLVIAGEFWWINQ